MDKSTGAVFSELSYKMLDSYPKTTNVENINKSLQEKGMNNWYISPDLSNKNISTFVNDDEKKSIVVHRGTDTSGKKTKSDVGADVLLGLGQEKNSRAFNSRKNRTEAIIKAIPEDYKIYGAGHSYGGASIGYALEKSKLARNRIEKVRTYNAGASPFQENVNKKKKEILDNKITHHRTSNDLVSASLLVNRRYGKIKTQDTLVSSVTKWIPSHLKHIFNTADSLNAHKLNHFIK